MSAKMLAEVMEASWPPARTWQLGPFTLREGAGGGQRVSAASVRGGFDEGQLEATIAAMQTPLFVLRPGDEALDAALAARGFHLHDPVVAYAAPVATLAAELPFLTTFPHWPPLEATRAIWSEGGIDPARVQVMQRAAGAKCAILARSGDRPAGAVFVACHGPHAMLHALEVLPAQRRQGAGRHLLAAAANWAAAQGAADLSLVVTARNTAARALYHAAGMQDVGQYHYRKR
ncbi:MAG: GNAT family N-acetyltransferase [Paracoccaceae bacterium]